MVEVNGDTWFAAERSGEGETPQRFIATDFRQLVPLLRDTESSPRWRCFAFLRGSKGVMFDEIEEVIDLPHLKVLVFVLTSGFVASAGYDSQDPQFSNPATFKAPKTIPRPVVESGTHLFRFWTE